MKKVLLLTITVISVLLIAACSTTGSTGSTGPAPQNPTEEALQDVYNRYRNALILTGATNYTVKSGDTLSAVAREQYNNGFLYPVIMLASKDVVLDADKIEPGMKLVVPDLQRNLNDARAKANIKNYLLEIADVEEKRNRRDTADGIRRQANSL